MENLPPPSGASRNYEYLGKKTLWIFILNGSVPAFVVLLISAILFFAGGKVGQVDIFNILVLNLINISLFGFALFFVVLAITVFIGWLIYANYRFFLDDDSLKIKRGVFNKEEIAIPYRQIQDVAIERDLSYQIWGLSRLVILTAGHEDVKGGGESEGILPSLDKDVAERLQEELLRRADIQKVMSEGK